MFEIDVRLHIYSSVTIPPAGVTGSSLNKCADHVFFLFFYCHFQHEARIIQPIFIPYLSGRVLFVSLCVLTILGFGQSLTKSFYGSPPG